MVVEKDLSDDDAGAQQKEKEKLSMENQPSTSMQGDTSTSTIRDEEIQAKEWKYSSSHPKELIIGYQNEGIQTRSHSHNLCQVNAFISQIEPKTFEEAKSNEDWIMAMQEELNKFERGQVWDLVPRPSNKTIIGTKWVFKNKIVIRNNARLVAKGYNQ